MGPTSTIVLPKEDYVLINLMGQGLEGIFELRCLHTDPEPNIFLSISILSYDHFEENKILQCT